MTGLVHTAVILLTPKACNFIPHVCLRRSKTYVFFLAGQWGWGSVSVSESVCVFLYGVIMTMSETE